MGRPTKYEQRFAQELIAFFAASSDVWEERVLKTAGGGERLELVPKKFPTLARFATMIDVNFTTVYRWAHEKDEDGNPVNAEFCNAYAHAKALQEAILIEGGITMINELIDNKVIDRLELSVTQATGGEDRIDWKELLARFKSCESREVEGTTFYTASN